MTVGAQGVVQTLQCTVTYREGKLIGQTDLTSTLQKPPTELCRRLYQTIQNKEVFAMLNFARVC